MIQPMNQPVRQRGELQCRPARPGARCLSLAHGHLWSLVFTLAMLWFVVPVRQAAAQTAPVAAVDETRRAPPPSAGRQDTCEGPALHLRPLAPDLWWIASEPGEADARNRGHVSNILVGRDGARLWLIGSGPSPRFGVRLACQLRRSLGLAPTDVISPWPHPENVGGVAALGHVRHWAHADVARRMASHCATCVARLRLRLGAAAADLGDDPIRLPQHHVVGEQGRLGPWHWWRADRAPGVAVTVWQWRDRPLLFAPGVLWQGEAPDGYDTTAGEMAAASQALDRIAWHRRAASVARWWSTAPTTGERAAPATGWQWLGEQGGPLPADAAARHADYWRLLAAAAEEAAQRGDDGSAAPPVLARHGELSRSRAHALNWQRSVRQAEEGLFQRSRR